VTFISIWNETRRAMLARSAHVADSSRTRRRGLLDRDSLPPGEGLWIKPCEGIHTFFMKFPIDVVYMDKKMRVRKLRPHLGPWRLSICLSAYSVLELPAGTISSSGTARGDVLQITPMVSPEIS
jgi:uncharacterized membrane protein (UPF0127 family)